MQNKIKHYSLLTFMCLSCILMFETKYLRAPGDYLLEFIGLKSWTNGTQGTHLTVIYFGILFFISLFLIEAYIVNQSKMKWRRIIFILAFSTMVYAASVSTIVQVMMRNSETLTSIEYQSEVGHLSFEKDKGTFTSFNVQFQLNNKSRDSRSFYVDLDSYWRREDGQSRIQVLDKNGDRALFTLEGDSSSVFEITEVGFVLKDEDNDSSYSTHGVLDELILTDLQGNSIVLEHDRGYTLTISK